VTQEEQYLCDQLSDQYPDATSIAVESVCEGIWTASILYPNDHLLRFVLIAHGRSERV
jgi:hypothetical protein